MIGENDEYVDPVQHPSLSCLTQSHPENRPRIRILHGGKPKFVHSERSAAFRAQFFPEATEMQWNDWHWQIRHRIRDVQTLVRFLELSNEEQEALSVHRGSLPLSITPYYLSLLDRTDPHHPIRRSVVPVTAEFRISPEESGDPLGEEHTSPVPGLVHRYPDRVLFRDRLLFHLLLPLYAVAHGG